MKPTVGSLRAGAFRCTSTTQHQGYLHPLPLLCRCRYTNGTHPFSIAPVYAPSSLHLAGLTFESSAWASHLLQRRNGETMTPNCCTRRWSEVLCALIVRLNLLTTHIIPYVNTYLVQIKAARGISTATSLLRATVLPWIAAPTTLSP